MSLSLAQWRELHGIGKQVGRSDPRLASALALFACLASGEPMPRHERLCARAWRLWAVPLLVMATVDLVIRRVASGARRALARTRPSSRIRAGLLAATGRSRRSVRD